MAFGDADLDAFTADFGVPVSFAGAPAGLKGVVDTFDDVVLDDGGAVGAVGRDRGVLLKTSALGSLAHGAAITVDGAGYTVRRVLALPGDGAFSAVLLRARAPLPAPTSAVVTLSAPTTAEDDTAPLTATALVLPTGAPQAGLWSSDAPSVATVDATTGALTRHGPGTAEITFTPTGHPEAAGSATLTVLAVVDLSYAPTLFWDLVAAPGRPAPVIDHRYPSRMSYGRRIYLPRAAGRWGYAGQTLSAPGIDVGVINKSGNVTAVNNDTATTDGFFPELGGLSQGAGQYAPTVSRTGTIRVAFPGAVGSTGFVATSVAFNNPDANPNRSRQTAFLYIARARPGQLGKKVRVNIEGFTGAGNSISGGRLLATKVVTLSNVDQYIALTAPADAARYACARTYEVLAERATDFDIAGTWDVGTMAWGDTRHVGSAEWPTHASFGLLHQWPTRNSWLNSDAPLTAGGATITPSAESAPDDGHDGERRTLFDVVLPAGATLSGPAADFQIGTGNGSWEDETNNNTGLKPNFVWVGMWGEPAALAALEAYVVYPDLSESAHVALTDYDTAALADAQGRRFYRARIAVNTAGQNAKTLTPVLRNASGAAGAFRGYRCFALAEQLNEQRTQGWHSCLVPPRSGATPAASDQLYATVDLPTYLTRQQGVIGIRFMMPFDIWDIAQRGGKFDLLQAGMLGSPADLGMSLSIYKDPATGTVMVQANSNTNVDNAGTPISAAAAGGMGFNFRITGPGVWPAYTPIDLAWRWDGYGATTCEVMLGVGAGPNRWFANGDTLPAGYAGPAAGATKLSASGGQGSIAWTFSGPFCFGSDVDFTGQNGGFTQGWILGNTAATRAQVEGQLSRLAHPRTSASAPLRAVAGWDAPAAVIAIAGQGATPMRVVPLDANGDGIPERVVTFASTNAAVVSVDALGDYTPVAPGTATITATCGGQTLNVPVTVTDGLAFATTFPAAEPDWWEPRGVHPSTASFDPVTGTMTVANGVSNFVGVARRGFARADGEYEAVLDDYGDCALYVQKSSDDNGLHLLLGADGSLDAYRVVNGTTTLKGAHNDNVVPASPGQRTIRLTLTGPQNNILNLWSRNGAAAEVQKITNLDVGAGAAGGFWIANRNGGTGRVQSVRAGTVGALPAFPP